MPIAENERFTANPDETRATVADEAWGQPDALLDWHADLPARATGVHVRAVAEGNDAATGVLDDQPTSSVIEYSVVADTGGVTLVDTPSRFEEAATGLAEAGAQVIGHGTAEGIPAGQPMVAVLKISGRAETVAVVPDNTDVAAQSTSGKDLTERLVATARGPPTCAEEHGLTEFAITRIGPSMRWRSGSMNVGAVRSASSVITRGGTIVYYNYIFVKHCQPGLGDGHRSDRLNAR